MHDTPSQPQTAAKFDSAAQIIEHFAEATKVRTISASTEANERGNLQHEHRVTEASDAILSFLRDSLTNRAGNNTLTRILENTSTYQGLRNGEINLATMRALAQFIVEMNIAHAGLWYEAGEDLDEGDDLETSLELPA